jgi:TRAP-type C4-dicarboxylate transport system permease small subunit
MRRLLDALYRLSGALGALSVVAVFSIVLLQVSCTAVDKASGWVAGAPIGLVVPSYAELAGFFLAAASFLALASTFQAGGHVRVVLVLQRAPASIARWLELWNLAVAAGAAGFFAWHAIRLAADSHRFGDVSPGLVPVPLWLPQAAMALGLVILTIALVDGLLGQLRREHGTTPDAVPVPLGEAVRPRPAA